MEWRAHLVVGVCVHYENNLEVIKRLGYPVPASEQEIARLAHGIAVFALHGVNISRADGKKRTESG